jgi:hypothetical protein
MGESTTGLLKNNQKNLGISLILLLSFLMMRFIVAISEFFFYGYPPFRIMMGLAIVFVLIIPIFVIFLSAKTMKPGTSFLLPFVIGGIIFPVCDSFFLDPGLLLYPPFYLSFLIGGFGYGLIGLSGNYYENDFKKMMIFFTVGMAIILANSVNFIPITYYVLTGDAAVLPLITGL